MKETKPEPKGEPCRDHGLLSKWCPTCGWEAVVPDPKPSLSSYLRHLDYCNYTNLRGPGDRDDRCTCYEERIKALMRECEGARATAFKCKARSVNAGGNDPQDCDWPTCGCDPYADKVIEALQESGKLGVAKPVASPTIVIEIERETDGRWIADIPAIPGVMAYGESRLEAVEKALTLRDEVVPEPPTKTTDA